MKNGDAGISDQAKRVIRQNCFGGLLTPNHHPIVIEQNKVRTLYLKYFGHGFTSVNPAFIQSRLVGFVYLFCSTIIVVRLNGSPVLVS